MIENLDTLYLFAIGSFKINATIFYTWVIMIILLSLGLWIKHKIKTCGQMGAAQIIAEYIITALQKNIYDISNDNPLKYLPFIGTLFIFIATANLLAVIPGFQLPTSSLTTTVAMACCVFFAIPYYGIKNAGWNGYFKKFIQPTPLMLPMNIMSDFSSTFSLAFRLYGNMLSGVVIGSVLLTLVPFLVPLPMQLLGLLTGTIQAYIFALLAIVYVSGVAPQESVLLTTDTKGE